MKKGISFTLTIIIVAVVLMAGALTLVTLFGAGVGDFFGAITQTSTEAQLRSQCGRVISTIDREVCSRVPEDGDNNPSSLDELSRAPILGGGDSTCDAINCDFSSIVDAGDLGEDFYIVTIDGDEYDCQEEGYIVNEECPISMP